MAVQLSLSSSIMIRLFLLSLLISVQQVVSVVDADETLEVYVSDFSREYKTVYGAKVEKFIDRPYFHSDEIAEDDIVFNITINGDMIPVKVNLGSAGILAGSVLSTFQPMCEIHNILNVECAQVLRTTTIEMFTAKYVANFCDGVFSGKENKEKNEACYEVASRLFGETVQRIIKLSDKGPQPQAITSESSPSSVINEVNRDKIGIGVDLPTFSSFENSSYGKLCAQLSDFATEHKKRSFEREGGKFGKVYQVEGSIWGSSDAAAREAFVSAVSLIDLTNSLMHSTKKVSTSGPVHPQNGPTWNYVEIGFNAGHSAAIVLTLFPNAIVSSFDLCAHEYTIPNAEYLSKLFPGRLFLYCGDSRKTLPDWLLGVNDASSSPTLQAKQASIPFSPVFRQSASIVRIDGGHSFHVAAADIVNGRKLAFQNALVLVDDCEDIQVYTAWEVAVELGVVKPLLPGVGWKGSCVGTYI